MNDHYSILGVDPSATVDEIRTAFRQLALRYHPDVNSSPGAAARFQEIYAAYEVLTDPSRRAEYDAARAGGTSQEPQPRSATSRMPHSRANTHQNARQLYFQRRIKAATDADATWTHYDVLGVRIAATEETIVRAYQRLYRQFHHSRGQDSGMNAILREIIEAREVLLNPEKRQAYDLLPPDQQGPGRPEPSQPTTTRRSPPRTYSQGRPHPEYQRSPAANHRTKPKRRLATQLNRLMILLIRRFPRG